MNIIIFLLSVIFIFVAIYGTHVVRKHTIKIKKNIPNKIKYIHISDIHNKRIFLNGKLRDIINSNQPDFVVVTGDYSANQKNLPDVIKELGCINAPVYLVLGNYERREKVNLFKKRSITLDLLMEEVKKYRHLKLLINESHLLKVGATNIFIYGFDNSSYGNESYDLTNKQLNSHFSIMLAHSPRIIRYIEANQISFNHILVGHTHGKQVNIPYLSKTPYDEFHIGFKKIGKDRYFSISKGLGTTKVSLRINAQPEVVIYEVSGE